MGLILVRTEEPPSHPRYPLSMFLSEDPHAMGVLSHIP